MILSQRRVRAGGRVLPLAVLVSACLLAPSTAPAVQAPDLPGEAVQPGGKVIAVRIFGDEWSNSVRTLDGYAIGRAPDGYWRYVERYAGTDPVLSSQPADEAPPSGVARALQPARQAGASRARERRVRERVGPAGPLDGRILYILAAFTDRGGTYSPASFARDTAKINDYFSKASYGKVALAPAFETHGTPGDGVVGWLNLGYAHPNTGMVLANQQLARDAIVQADAFVDYASYDRNGDGFVDGSELAVVVIVAGYERSMSARYVPSVWGHSWSLDDVGVPILDGVVVGAFHDGRGGYAQFGEIQRSTASDKHRATIGVMAHELGHLVFDLPDLYDLDRSSSGIGGFCLMSGGNWGKTATQGYQGQTPVLPSAWVRYALGWVDGEEVESGTRWPVAAGASTAGPSNTVYRAGAGTPGEYFLAEVRRPVGYDKGLQLFLGTSFGGVALWHVDESVTTNENDGHRWVDLEEADGTPMRRSRGSTRDLWYVGNRTVFGPATNPDTRRYDGAATNVSIAVRSRPATTMRVDFSR